MISAPDPILFAVVYSLISPGTKWHLSLRFLYCSFHVRFSFTVTPRYLTFLTRLIGPPFMCISNGP